jgi:tetraacyldisaccharide 4'-kinase
VPRRLVDSGDFSDNRRFLPLRSTPLDLDFVISPTDFRDVVSGRRRGMAATLLRPLLRAGSIPYGWVIGWRNNRYNRGAVEIRQAGVPVVSIGNLTVGGTGKTPLVQWLARHARREGVRVAILSRGYGAEQGGVNDEALELELALPDVPHLQDPDRAASAAIAVNELATQLLLLDDGFQHRRLARDLDIVLLDASEPFGFDYLLPRGTLREPVSSLRRAKVIVLSRADMATPAVRDAIRQRALSFQPAAVWCEVEHRPAALLDAAGGEESLKTVADQSVAAFCGIGNPAGFRHTLEALGCRVVAWREFPDHHNYTRADVDELAQMVAESGVRQVLCTRKDLVKLRIPAIAGAPLRAVGVELKFLTGESELTAALAPIIEWARGVAMVDFDELSAD